MFLKKGYVLHYVTDVTDLICLYGISPWYKTAMNLTIHYRQNMICHQVANQL